MVLTIGCSTGLPCRKQVETMLLRVDSAVADNGMVVASVSRQRGGFAPYRLDNCSPETLYVRYA